MVSCWSVLASLCLVKSYYMVNTWLIRLKLVKCSMASVQDPPSRHLRPQTCVTQTLRIIQDWYHALLCSWGCHLKNSNAMETSSVVCALLLTIETIRVWVTFTQLSRWTVATLHLHRNSLCFLCEWFKVYTSHFFFTKVVHVPPQTFVYYCHHGNALTIK